MCTCLGRRGSLVRIQSPRPLFEFRGNTGVTPAPGSVFGSRIGRLGGKHPIQPTRLLHKMRIP
jgi:hypothetical protein